MDNVTHANALAANADRVVGRVVNAACGRAISLNQIVKTINGILGKNVTPIYTDPRPGDVRHSLADNSLARELLGYEPSVGFDEGLARTIRYYQSL